ncbi:MAG: amino acid ABC transporter permease, partial [Verrucomicrobiales bacterium]|nr:amino acid ABC transporter permease [Verrucomicrobiales bacterium]
LLWKGWLYTLGLAGVSLALSAVIGATAALAARGRLLTARVAVRFYVELVRGTPFLVPILVLFYVVAPAIGLGNRYVGGTLSLSLFAGAYITEILRAGIESVGSSQWESARSLGLSQAQIYRLVVFPQALRVSLPPLAGQFVSLVKDSSLLSVIGIGEFALNAQQVNALAYGTLEGYLPLAAGYLVLTLPISLWARRLERRVHHDS